MSKVIERTSNEAFQAMWIEIHFENKKNIVCGIVDRQQILFKIILTNPWKSILIESLCTSLEIFYLDLLKSESCNYSHRFLLSLQSCHFMPTIDKPTRVHGNSATLIDNIFTNCPEQHIISGNIIYRL